MHCFVQSRLFLFNMPGTRPGCVGSRAVNSIPEETEKQHLASIYHIFPLFKNKTRLCSENKKLETCDTLPVWCKTIPVLISSLNS